MLKFIGLACVILMLHGTGHAADNQGLAITLGRGASSCGSYTAARSSSTDTNFVAWVTGFLSGANYYLPNTYDIEGKTDLDGVLGWLDNYCRNNPTRQFNTAAVNLVHFLYPTRETQKPH